MNRLSINQNFVEKKIESNFLIEQMAEAKDLS